MIITAEQTWNKKHDVFFVRKRFVHEMKPLTVISVSRRSLFKYEIVNCSVTDNGPRSKEVIR